MRFPPTHVLNPQSTHTHTAILLHGRASDGSEFVEDFLKCMTSQQKTLPDSLPNWRWVLPTSRIRRSTVFQENMLTWFDASSLDDIQKDQELQVEGLRESVSHVLDILEEEIILLNGRSDRVFLGGISQGMATALWSLLCAPPRIATPLGGFMGFCGWLPFAHQIEHLIPQSDTQNGNVDSKRRISDFLCRTIGAPVSLGLNPAEMSVLNTPVFLSHGVDDSTVSVDLGRQAAQVLRKLDIPIEMYEHEGAELDGHWVKEPEGFDQILEFMERHSVQ